MVQNCRCAFFGTPELAVPFLTYLKANKINIVGVITQPDKPKGRRKQLKPSPVSVVANKFSLPLFKFNSLKTKEAAAELSGLKPDLFIVVAYGQIIPKAILALPALESLNVHPSLLPKYRGPSPIPAPILNGDTETGITIIKLDAGMDTGPILQSLTIPLDRNETSLLLTAKIMDQGPTFLLRVIKGYLDGSIVPRQQNADDATYTEMIAKEDGLINWSESGSIIERKIRAYQPWPVAYTYWNGKKLDILEAETSSLMTTLMPGSLTLRDGQVGIVTGSGLEGNILILKKVRLESKKEMPIEAFLRGQPNFLKGSIGK